MREHLTIPAFRERGPIVVAYDPRRVESKAATFGLKQGPAIEFVSKVTGKSLATVPRQMRDAEFLIADGADFGVSFKADGSMLHRLKGYFFSPLTIRFCQPLPG